MTLSMGISFATLASTFAMPDGVLVAVDDCVRTRKLIQDRFCMRPACRYLEKRVFGYFELTSTFSSSLRSLGNLGNVHAAVLGQE